ncbi:ADP-ribosyltransferase [Mycolicibacterium sp. CBM1]
MSLQVAPAALSGAGVSVAGIGDGLAAALSALTVGFNANTGQDAAGSSFGVAYRDSARAVVEAVTAGVNALHNAGYRIQGSAANYSRAEAAADIGGGAVPLPAPVSPAMYSAPSGGPDVNGPGVAAPLLWSLVEALVGDFWPNGQPNEMRSAAMAWSAFAAPLYNVTSDNAGAYGVIDAQQMPEKEKMKAAVRDIGTAMSSLAGQAQALAGELNNFATDVETTQNAVRSLLDTLKSVVGSVMDQGILGTVVELVTGDVEEKIQQVADDIKAVLANHRRQSAARKEAIGMLVNSIENYSRAMETVTRGELVHYLGEDAGRIVANINDAITDASVGIAKGGINTVGGIATLDPIGDPKGTWETLEGLSKSASALNPLTMPTAFAADPKGTVETLKDVTHFDDIVNSDRPFIGLGELGFDVGTAIVPGGAAAKAGAGVRATEGAAARSEFAAGERAAGEVAAMGTTAGRLEGVADAAGGVKARLDDIADSPTPAPTDTPKGGAPQSLPDASKQTVPPVAREPAAHDPAPAVGKPTSAPASAEPVSPPVTHTPEGAQVPKGEIGSARGSSEIAAPRHASTGEASHASSAPSFGQSSAPTTQGPSLRADGMENGGGVGPPGGAVHSEGGGLHDGGGSRGGSDDHQPNNPPHTGLHDPPENHGVTGHQLPDLTDINNEYRMPSGAVDPERFDEWAEKVSERYPQISPEGVGGVYNYSSELFQGMNPYLREADSLDLEQQDLLGARSVADMTSEQRVIWEDRIRDTDDGLAALPPYRADPSDLTSTTWRGMRASDSLLARLHEGQIFHDPGYMSTTTDSFVAESFARGARPGETPTLIEVVGDDGVAISPLSKFADESEVLFPRGSSFEVLARTTGGDGIVRIVMRQAK